MAVSWCHTKQVMIITLASDVNLPVKNFSGKKRVKKSGTNPIKSLTKSLGAWLQIIYSKVSENENRRNFLEEGSNEGKLEQKYG